MPHGQSESGLYFTKSKGGTEVHEESEAGSEALRNIKASKEQYYLYC